MSAVMQKASSIQGWTHALITASFSHATSTYSFNAFACCSVTSCWVRTTIYTIPRTLSYCIWSTHTSVSKCCMVGSSCKEVRTLKDSSSMVVQVYTSYPISSSPFWILAVHYSETFGGMDDYVFNHSSTIWRLRSSWILVASYFALRNPLANLWICTIIGRSIAICSSGVQWHASSTIYSSYWLYTNASSHCRLSCSMLICCSLSICTTHPSIERSYSIAPSCSWYNISHGREEKLRPSPLIWSTVAILHAICCQCSFRHHDSPSQFGLQQLLCCWCTYGTVGNYHSFLCRLHLKSLQLCPEGPQHNLLLHHLFLEYLPSDLANYGAKVV